MKKIRILVVEDQSVIREGVIAILSFQPEVEVVGEAEDGLKAVQVARKTKPDVVLLDMLMPGQDGLMTIPKIKEASPNSQILVLTSFDVNDQAYKAIKAGALGYMLKDSNRVELMQAIRSVADGKAAIHPSVAMKVINGMDKQDNEDEFDDKLTPRETETLQLIAKGLSNQEIAMALVVHERTIAKYVSNILNKLHVTNRTQAALYAIRQGGMTAAMN